MSTINAANIKNASSASNNIVLNSDGTSTFTPSNVIKSGTAVASTSGVSIDFTGIPGWVKRVTVMFNGVSLSGTSDILVQLGTAVGIESTGYGSSSIAAVSASVGAISSTAGFILNGGLAAVVQSGHLVVTNVSGNIWTGSHAMGRSDAAGIRVGGGSKTLSNTLDRIRITTVNGTDTFDAGSINILYEG